MNMSVKGKMLNEEGNKVKSNRVNGKNLQALNEKELRDVYEELCNLKTVTLTDLRNALYVMMAIEIDTKDVYELNSLYFSNEGIEFGNELVISRNDMYERYSRHLNALYEEYVENLNCHTWLKNKNGDRMSSKSSFGNIMSDWMQQIMIKRAIKQGINKENAIRVNYTTLTRAKIEFKDVLDKLIEMN